MKYTVLVGEKICEVEFIEDGGKRRILWDGEPVEVDLGQGRPGAFTSLLIEGHPYEIALERNGEAFSIDLDGSAFTVQVHRGSKQSDRVKLLQNAVEHEIVLAPMPGMVVDVKVEREQEVDMGQPLLILEAMKMENELRSPVHARVSEICVEKGRKVEKGERLIVLQKKA